MSHSVAIEQPRADVEAVTQPVVTVTRRGDSTLTSRAAQMRRDDDWLAARVGRMRPEPFEVLAARWRPRLLAYCLRRLRSREEADDTAQEILERAYRTLARSAQAGEPHRLGPLMFTIARNACIDRLRASARLLEGVLDEESPSLALSVGEWLERRDQFDATLRDMQSLSVRQREALLLREMCGLSGDTIAERLGVTTMAAKSLISEARRVLTERRAGRELDCETFSLLVAATRQPHRSHRLQAHVDGCTRCQLTPAVSRRTHALVPALGLGGAARLLSRWARSVAAAPAGAAIKATAVTAVIAAGGVGLGGHLGARAHRTAARAAAPAVHLVAARHLPASAVPVAVRVVGRREAVRPRPAVIARRTVHQAAPARAGVPATVTAAVPVQRPPVSPDVPPATTAPPAPLPSAGGLVHHPIRTVVSTLGSVARTVPAVVTPATKVPGVVASLLLAATSGTSRATTGLVAGG